MWKKYISIKDAPRRIKGEETATPNQIGYLRSMTDFKEADIYKLGKWQALYLINKIKNSGEAASPRRRKRDSKGVINIMVKILFVLIAVVVGLVIHFKMKANEASNGNSAIDSSGVQRINGNTPAHPASDGKSSAEGVDTKQKIVTSFENVTIPVEVTNVDALTLLDSTGKESSIPSGTVIKIEKRSQIGTLTMRINDVLYVGNEARLLNKVKF